MGNINDSFFEGYYKDIWKAIIPEELTRRESDFLFSYFGLQSDQRVLDLMCGYGRHALSIARKGLEVVAVDNLSDYISEIQVNAEKEGLNLKAIQSDILSFALPGQFDLVLCMGNSLNFFNAADTSTILTTVEKSLKSGGHLLINTWSLAEIAYRQFQENSEGEIDGVKISSSSKFYSQPDRIETETRMVSADGNIETRNAIDYIFSINEVEALLFQTGLQLKEIYSIPGKKKFSLGDPRAYIIAQKK